MARRLAALNANPQTAQNAVFNLLKFEKYFARLKAASSKHRSLLAQTCAVLNFNFAPDFCFAKPLGDFRLTVADWLREIDGRKAFPPSSPASTDPAISSSLAFAHRISF